MIFIILLALVCFGVAAFCISKAAVYVVKAVLIKYSSESQIDESYKKHVVAKSDEYKEFEANLSKSFRDGV